MFMKNNLALLIIITSIYQVNSMQHPGDDVKRAKLENIRQQFTEKCIYECEVSHYKKEGYKSCTTKCENLDEAFKEIFKVLADN